ncbi:MAG: Asp-tRNA(Asn)/Glu-tRNA(Gln) amidotransferase subunit GatC [Puniceicoccales bacterium]|nr:Asp-tRNA(Asn)/Glu-tRNA(Gln) amidotransferase subunit GatC [Puniceicoccales bacterium]
MANRVPIDINRLAKLARIALTDDEKQRFSGELDGILGYFDQLEQADVAGVECSAHPFPVHNILREDQPAPSLPTEVLERLAPAFRDGHVLVPRVVDDEG